MKKVLIVGIFSLLIATPVYGHIAVQDGNVFAVLHIDPGDSPIVGEPAYLHFDFTGSKEIFNVSRCDCSVSISSKNEKLFDKKIIESEFSRDAKTITLNYTFPSRAIYTILLYGHTLSVSSSTPFELRYDVRVDRSTGAPTPSTILDFVDHTLWHHFAHIIIFGGAFAIGGYFSYRDWKKNRLVQKNN